MVQQRKSPRTKTSIAAAFRSDKEFLFGNILNIGRDGFFIKTKTLLPIDTEITLQIRLPNDPETMTIEGRVIWTKQLSSLSPAGMGIEFIKASAGNRKKIDLFLAAERRKLEPSKEPVPLFL